MYSNGNPGKADIIDGEYKLYIQIVRPDGVRCGFSKTYEMKGDDHQSITAASAKLKTELNKVATQARSKATEILTTPVDRVRQSEKYQARPVGP